MPELPEVENVRRSLAARVLGRTVRAVHIQRADIVTGEATPSALLNGRQFAAIDRHGKQLALIAARRRGGHGSNCPCLCVHLGMSGSLRHHHAGAAPDAGADQAMGLRHCHVTWDLDDGSRLVFRDPRRFGGIWTFRDVEELRDARWAQLGDDAMSITARKLATRLAETARPIKAALLDQGVVAGLGNIYVDETLFRAGIHPQSACHMLSVNHVQKIVFEVRAVLRWSIKAGGSTLRDYIDGAGQRGRFQARHAVYGRAGRGCRRCGVVLESLKVAGRTTVYCPACQI